MWFEASLQRFEAEPYRQFVTLGADYTFALGSGLHGLVEHLLIGQSQHWSDLDQDLQISAVTADYGFGLLDRVAVILTYDWDHQAWSRYLSWARIYDRWSFYLNGYWNSSRNAVTGLPGVGSTGSLPTDETAPGQGIQLLAVFNH